MFSPGAPFSSKSPVRERCHSNLSVRVNDCLSLYASPGRTVHFTCSCFLSVFPIFCIFLAIPLCCDISIPEGETAEWPNWMNKVYWILILKPPHFMEPPPIHTHTHTQTHTHTTTTITIISIWFGKSSITPFQSSLLSPMSVMVR